MGKFSSAKREEVRRKLKNAGIDLFSRYGIKKTTIDDIVRAAGIGKGTFYLFYPSKDDLLFEIVRDGYSPRCEFLIELQGADTPDVECIKNALRRMIRKLAENPILKLIGEENNQSSIRNVLSCERSKDHSMDDEYFFSELFGIMHHKGLNSVNSPELVKGLFHLIWLSVVHRNDISRDNFDEVMEPVIDMVAGQLL